MTLIPAICPYCNANIKVDAERNVEVCEVCGQKFSTEDAINKYKAFKQNVILTDENDYLRTRADSALTKGEYQKAFFLYKQYAEKRPNDFYGWFGCARAATKDFTKQYNLSIVEACMKRAKDVATTNELIFIKENSCGYDDINFISEQAVIRKKTNIVKIAIPVLLILTSIVF